MAKVPAFAKALAGRWRIVETDVWDNEFLDEFLDLVKAAHITFQGGSDGDRLRRSQRRPRCSLRLPRRSACAEFSWEGNDEGDPVCGRGWVTIGTAGRLVGHFYIHNGDDSGFRCERD